MDSCGWWLARTVCYSQLNLTSVRLLSDSMWFLCRFRHIRYVESGSYRNLIDNFCQYFHGKHRNKNTEPKQNKTYSMETFHRWRVISRGHRQTRNRQVQNPDRLIRVGSTRINPDQPESAWIDWNFNRIKEKKDTFTHLWFHSQEIKVILALRTVPSCRAAIFARSSPIKLWNSCPVSSSVLVHNGWI